MSKTILVIVESPGKIEKIQHILGDNYIVKASYGHIIDLNKKTMSIDFNTYQPQYNINDEKKQKLVSNLIKEYNKVDDVLLATDEDREGEMIAWSLAKELNIKDPKRITFNSITKEELLNAVKKPRQIDYNLVDAQKLRRVLDRIIGYSISPLIWKNIGGGGKASAGRVQSVVVRLIVEKENEIKQFFEKGEDSFFKICGEFFDSNYSYSSSSSKKTFKSFLYKNKKDKNTKNTKKDNKNDEYSDIDDEYNDNDEEDNEKKENKDKDEDKDEDEVKSGLAKIKKSEEIKELMNKMIKSEYTVFSIKERESIRNPSAPFTTSTLQQESSHKFGYSSARTMSTAQHLYEAGYITYMRTDSVNLSTEAIKIIGNFIVSKYGKEYYRQKNYSFKLKNTQEAHEAIRPTDPKVIGISENKKQKIGKEEINLYNLIWKRAISSQMSPAKFNITSINIDINKLSQYYFVTQIENVIFDGFLAVYNIQNTDEDDKDDKDEDKKENQYSNMKIPKVGTKLKVDIISSIQEYKKPPCRYNDASLVRKLDPKNLNIGRPSTYASIIEKIQTSGYVSKESCEGIKKKSMIYTWNGTTTKINESSKDIILGKDKDKFTPSSLGNLITDYLIKCFPEIMNYAYTSNMEDKLDKIAEGSLTYINVFKEFYNSFQKLITELTNTTKSKELFTKYEKELGIHPTLNKKIIITMGYFGPCVIMIADKKKDYITAPIKKPLTLENITLNDALEILKFPKDLGKYEKKKVILQTGKFGYYLKYGDECISLKEGKDEKEGKVEKGEKDEINEIDNKKELYNKDNIGDFDLDDAIKIIDNFNKKKIWEGKDKMNIYNVRYGKFGLYITAKPLKGGKFKTKNYKLPVGTDPKLLTLEQVGEIISNSYKNRKYKKKTNNNDNDNDNDKIETKIDKLETDDKVPKLSKASKATKVTKASKTTKVTKANKATKATKSTKANKATKASKASKK